MDEPDPSWEIRERWITQKVDALVSHGFSFDFIAEWVAQRRCWIGIDGRATA